MKPALCAILLLTQAPASQQSAPASQPLPRCEVVGLVTDLAGTPIPGAAVRAGREDEPASADLSPPLVRSGPDGRFAVHLPLSYPDTPGGAGPVLLVAAPGRASARIELPLCSVEDRAAPMDLGPIALPPGRLLRGVVTGKDGRPVDGARVRAREVLTYRSSSWWGETARSGANGVFVLPGVVAGPLVLEVSADGFAQRILAPVVGNDLITVVLLPTGFVTGRLSRGPEAPPFRGTVRLVSEWSEDGTPVPVGDDGSFRLPIPWQGRFCVAAYSGEALGGQSEVLGGPVADLQIALGATPPLLRVRARDRETGAWIHAFRGASVMQLGTVRLDSYLHRWTVASDPDGVLQLGAVLPGALKALPIPQKLLFEAPGFACEVMDLEPSTETRIVELSRRPAVVGRVTGSDKSPRAGVLVSVRMPLPRGVAAPPVARVLTDADGRFAIRTMWNGTFELSLTGPAGIEGASMDITADTARAPAPLELVLSDEVMVHGTAQNAAPGSRLAILPGSAWETWQAQRRQNRVTSAVPAHTFVPIAPDGRFVTRAVVAGKERQVVVLWTPSPEPGEPGIFTVVALQQLPPLGEAMVLDVGPARPAILRGKIEWSGPAKLLRQMALVATPAVAGPGRASGEPRFCAIQEGRFSLRLPPGAWTLAVRDMSSGPELPCDPNRIEATAGEEQSQDLTLRAAAVELRLSGPDQGLPIAENLHIRSGAHVTAGRGASVNRAGGFLGPACRDLRGVMAPLLLLLPEGDNLLWVQRGAARLVPSKEQRPGQSLAEILLEGLKSGELRTEKLTLSAPLPITH